MPYDRAHAQDEVADSSRRARDGEADFITLPTDAATDIGECLQLLAELAKMSGHILTSNRAEQWASALLNTEYHYNR